MARRGLQVMGLGVVVAVVLNLLAGKPLWVSLVYSECIALSSWLLIDGGRRLVALWVHRNTPDEPGGRLEWPGWPWMLVCTVLGTLIGVWFGSGLADWLVHGGVRTHPKDSLDNLLTVLLISAVPSALATYHFWSRGRLQAAQAQAEAALRLAAENRLKLLESQLEPHMLFNTLANLRVLIAVDPVRAQDMLDRLIAFLRATLGASRAQQHTLAAEFARLADYLALMKVRMGARLQEERLLPPELADLPVPPLLLQPLVENAIKHGLEPNVAGGRLRISARRDGATLVLEVRDTGVGLQPAAAPAADGGFGLQQVRDRLSTLYGPGANLRLAPAADAEGGTVATVRLPAADAAPTPAEPVR
jgi:signal transduction histidine kinase